MNSRKIQKIVPLVLMILLAAVGICFASAEETSDARRIWDMVWRVINFIILVAILWKLLADKIKVYFGQRRSEIASSIDEVDKAKLEAEKRHAEYEQKLKNVEDDINEIKNMLIGEMENEKTRIIDEGKEAATRIIEQAKWSAEQEVLKARRELNDYVVDMAADMAVGVVSEAMTEGDQKRILEEYLDEVVRKN